MAVLVAISQPTSDARLDDIFRIVREVAIVEHLCEGSLIVVSREIKERILHPSSSPCVRIQIRA